MKVVILVICLVAIARAAAELYRQRRWLAAMPLGFAARLARLAFWGLLLGGSQAEVPALTLAGGVLLVASLVLQRLSTRAELQKLDRTLEETAADAKDAGEDRPGADPPPAGQPQASGGGDPLSPPLSLSAAERIVVSHQGVPYELTVRHPAESPEGDDVLESSGGGQTFLIHSLTLFRGLLATPGRFLGDLTGAEAADLAAQPCLRVQFMDDSREYHDLTVGSRRVSVPGKYLGLTFSLVPTPAGLVMVTEHLVDEDFNELPAVVTPLSTDFVAVSSATFDEEDGGWVAT